MKIIKQFDIYKSHNVDEDNGHAHKLWHVDIIELANGNYQVRSHAQLFRENNGIITSDLARTYQLGTHSVYIRAEGEALERISKKRQGASKYEYWADRGSMDVTLDQTIINEFLSKYGMLCQEK